MNPIYNSKEQRLRSALRIPFFIVLFVILMSIGNSIPLMGFQYLISLGVLFGFFWFSFRFLDNRRNIDEAGLNLNPLWWKEFGLGTGIGALVMTLIFLTEWSMEDLLIADFAWNRFSGQSWLIPTLGYLAMYLSVGFYEEFMARSYLIPNIKEGFTFGSVTPERAVIVAVLLSSSIFGLLHALNDNATILAIVNIVGAGVMLAVPYVFTGRLALSVGLHFSWNFFQGAVYGFRVSGTEPLRPLIDIQQGGNPLWTGGGFGPEGGIIGILGIILSLILILFYIRKKEGVLDLHHCFQRTYLQNQQSLTKADELA